MDLTHTVDDAGLTEMDYLGRRPECEVLYEAFCALIVIIAPINGRCSMEDEFVDEET